jgi:hypothetical protein
MKWLALKAGSQELQARVLELEATAVARGEKVSA